MLYTVLIPLTITDDMLRTRRLLMFASQLDERSHNVFLSFPTRRAQSDKYILAYADAAEKYNGGEGAEDKVIQHFDVICGKVAAIFGNAESLGQRKSDLKKFGAENDRRALKMLRELVDPEKDFKTLRRLHVYIHYGLTNR
jgi:hypothetical protein